MTPDPGATGPEAGRRDLAIDDQEYRARLAGVRGRMSDLGLDVCLVSTPENILWLTGLDHWGYFAPHLLVVPTRGEMVLVTRAMEQVTVANQVRNAAFAGHPDSETVADVAVRLLRGRGAARIGLEAWSSGLPHGLARALETRAARGCATTATSRSAPA